MKTHMYTRPPRRATHQYPTEHSRGDECLGLEDKKEVATTHGKKFDIVAEQVHL